MRTLFTFLLFLATLQAHPWIESGEISRKQYLDLIQSYPQLTRYPGNYKKGEIQIVLDPQEMAFIENSLGRDVGLIQRDKYWLWINDACIFPNGTKGIYGRIVWVNTLEARSGVAVMPVTKEGKVILNCNFRHATRSWEIELPRGGVNSGEEVESAAKRETMEETGMIVSDLILLGEIPPDTGLTATVVPIFLAKVTETLTPEREDSEAIEENLALSLTEIKQAFLSGSYEHCIRGVKQKVSFRDPFLAYALLMYELKQHNIQSLEN